jgi:hypothetical protein
MSVGTIILSDVLAILVPAALVIWLLRHRRDYVPSTDLTRPGNLIATGVVEADAPPVTIDYKQRRYTLQGSSAVRSDGKTVYDWNEEDRQIHGKPFVLGSSGARIQVEPDEDDVSLLWEPTHTENNPKYDTSRVRRSILEPGTTVEIFGAYKPAPAASEPYRDAATLPTLVPSRVERLLISKRPLAPKLAALRRYLGARAVVVAACTAVAHVAVDPLLRADAAQLRFPMPSDSVRLGIGITVAVIAAYFWRVKRPWSDGPLNERIAR